MLTFCPLLITVAWKQLVSENEARKRALNAVFLVLILISVLLGIFNFYRSPWIGQVNDQTSISEYQGISWYFENRDPDLYTSTQSLNFRVWPHYYYGTSDAPKVKYNNKPLESHLGYDEHHYYGEGVGTSTEYLITNELDKISYLALPEDRRSAVNQYLPEDFKRLAIDPTANKIFATKSQLNGYEIWLIHKYEKNH